MLVAPCTAPPKLGRQENTRHSCAKVAAGRQAAGGGGPLMGAQATRTRGGFCARLALQLGHEVYLYECAGLPIPVSPSLLACDKEAYVVKAGEGCRKPASVPSSSSSV